MNELRVRVLSTYWQRLKGLLGTRANDRNLSAVLIERCHSVHTCGMRYNLDIAFVGAQGRVVKSIRNVRPGALVRAAGSQVVLERATSHEAWPHEGQRIQLGKPYQDTQGRKVRNVRF